MRSPAATLCLYQTQRRLPNALFLMQKGGSSVPTSEVGLQLLPIQALPPREALRD